MLKNTIKTHRTNILPLRWISNEISALGSRFLVKAVFLDEDNNYGFRYKLYSNFWKFADFFYSRWGTYYSVDMQAWLKDLKEDMAGEEWDDYDSDGNAYWAYHWHEDPLTGDAWRLKEKDIFETQVDFE